MAVVARVGKQMALEGAGGKGFPELRVFVAAIAIQVGVVMVLPVGGLGIVRDLVTTELSLAPHLGTVGVFCICIRPCASVDDRNVVCVSASQAVRVDLGTCCIRCIHVRGVHNTIFQIAS